LYRSHLAISKNLFSPPKILKAILFMATHLIQNRSCLHGNQPAKKTYPMLPHISTKGYPTFNLYYAQTSLTTEILTSYPSQLITDSYLSLTYTPTTISQPSSTYETIKSTLTTYLLWLETLTSATMTRIPTIPTIPLTLVTSW